MEEGHLGGGEACCDNEGTARDKKGVSCRSGHFNQVVCKEKKKEIQPLILLCEISSFCFVQCVPGDLLSLQLIEMYSFPLLW